MAVSERARIAIPCEDCPLGPNSEDRLNKIRFSSGGTIIYEPVDGGDCGINLRVADGPNADRTRERIIDCSEPETYGVATPGLLGKLGLKKAQSADCPALRIDPTSRRQLTEYFEGA